MCSPGACLLLRRSAPASRPHQADPSSFLSCPAIHATRIIKNMCGFACGDTRAVPSAAAPPDLQAEFDDAEGAGSGGSGKNGGAGGRVKQAAAAPTPAEQQEELAAQALALARRGGEAVVQAMARQAGAALQQRLHKLWDQASAPLAALAAGGADLQGAVHALHVLAVLAPAAHSELAPALEGLVPLVGLCLQHSSAALKLAAARCVAALAAAHTTALVPPLLRLLAPMLAGATRLAGCGGRRDVGVISDGVTLMRLAWDSSA